MNNGEFFNSLDYVYIFIALASTLMGLVRGLTRDFLSTCAWLGSGFLSTIPVPHVMPIIGRYVANQMLARCASLGLSYFASLVLCLLIVSFASRNVKNSVVSGSDRTAGILFGLLRGGAIPICCCLMMTTLGVHLQASKIIRESKISVLSFSMLGIPLTTPNRGDPKKQTGTLSSAGITPKIQEGFPQQTAVPKGQVGVPNGSAGDNPLAAKVVKRIRDTAALREIPKNVSGKQEEPKTKIRRSKRRRRIASIVKRVQKRS
ncbi:MAG: CvpA family protein [Holosporaceae bacterium]|jgi:uncharacterized membrane protein required for colicin V production|nr:CvpA family protein [Holosporaceae bacterium]